MPKTYGAWSNEIKLVFPGGGGGTSSSSRSSSSSSRSSSSSSRSSSSALSSTISLVCKNINLQLINGNNTYTGNIINPPAIATGGNIVTAKIIDTTSANNFTHYEIFVNGDRYLTSQKEMQFILDLNNIYEFEARSVCLASSSSANLGSCIQAIMSVENNGTIFTGEINEPPAQASNNKLEVRLAAPQNANINNLSFWEVAINENVYTVSADQKKFIFNGTAGSIYNIQARAICEIIPSSSSSGGGGGGSSTTTTSGCSPIKITDIESNMDSPKQRRYRFQFCVSDNSWIDTNVPTQTEINNGWYNNPQTFIQWRLLSTSGQPLDPAENTDPWITEPFFYNNFNTAAGYTVRKFAHVKNSKFIEDIRIDDLITSGGNITGPVLLEFRLKRASGNPSNPEPLRVSDTIRHLICLQGVYTNNQWVCSNNEEGGGGTPCFGRDLAGSREVPPCSPQVLPVPPGILNLFTGPFDKRSVPQEEGNPGGGRPLDIDKKCGECSGGEGNCASSTSSSGTATTQQGNILGNCYKSQNECGTNPFPIFNTFKVYCDAINGYFVSVGSVVPQALNACAPNLISPTSSSSSSHLLGQAGYIQAQGPIEKLIGIPR